MIWRLGATIVEESQDLHWIALLWYVYARYIRSECGSRKKGKDDAWRQLNKQKKEVEEAMADASRLCSRQVKI